MSGSTTSTSPQRGATRQPYLPPLAILAVIAVVGTITFLGPVVKPVLAAVFIFFIIQPAAQWLIDRGLSTWLAYLLLLFMVLIAGMGISRMAYRNLTDLQRRIPQYESRAIELLSQIPGIDPDQFKRPVRPLTPSPQKPPLEVPQAAGPSVLESVGVAQPTPVAVPAPPASKPLPTEPEGGAAEPVQVAANEPGETPLTPELNQDAAHETHGAAATDETPPPAVTTEVAPAMVTEAIPSLGLKQALPPPPPAQPDQLEGKTLLQIFDITGEAIGRVLVGTIMEWMEAGLMVIFYLIFVILDAQRLPSRIRRALPETGEQVVEMGEDINQSITEYMRVKTLVSLGMAVTGAVLMALFRLENWPLWALMLFLFNYVTYVGSLGALLPPIAIALLQFENPFAAIALGLLLAGNRFFWIDYVEIRAAGRKLSINAVLLLLSLAYWGRFWGVTGLVLAVPMLTAAKIALEKFPSTRNWAILISED